MIKKLKPKKKEKVIFETNGVIKLEEVQPALDEIVEKVNEVVEWINRKEAIVENIGPKLDEPTAELFKTFGLINAQETKEKDTKVS